jgi:hypothetical protein
MLYVQPTTPGFLIESGTRIVHERCCRGRVVPAIGVVAIAGGEANACEVGCAFSVWTQFTVTTGKKSGYPRGMPLVTRLLASSGAKA